MIFIRRSGEQIYRKLKSQLITRYRLLITGLSIGTALEVFFVNRQSAFIKFTRILNRYKPRVVIIFFGLPRSLRWSLESIERQVMIPLRQHFQVDVSVHSYVHYESYSNSRSGETSVELDNDEWKTLSPEFFELESVDVSKIQHEEFLREVGIFGDAWKDNLQSARNYIFALHSLERATSLVLYFTLMNSSGGRRRRSR